MDFKIKDWGKVRSMFCTIASATVIEAGDLVTLTAGVITKAVAASTAVAYALNGSADGETLIEITMGNEFTLTGTASTNFTSVKKGTEVDLVGTTTQLINLAASATDVLLVSARDTAGTVGATENIEVRINRPLF